MKKYRIIADEEKQIWIVEGRICFIWFTFLKADTGKPWEFKTSQDAYDCIANIAGKKYNSNKVKYIKK